MGTHRIKMIATDIDGTMLRSDQTLSDRVRKSLWAARDAGMHIVPATGRPLVVAQNIIRASRLGDYWVLANGAITYHADSDEIVRGFWLQENVVRPLVESLRAAIPGIEFTIEFERSAVFEEKFRSVVPGAPEDFYDAQPVDDVVKHLRAPIQKILAFQPKMAIDALYSEIRHVVGDSLVASYSGMPFIELAASQITKAHALSELGRQLGVGAHEVAAFGDNHNDIPMLEWAGQSYAMGNASDDAREAADTVIGSNDEDGLAVEVDRLVEEFKSG